jgi:hypothetical protein
MSGREHPKRWSVLATVLGVSKYVPLKNVGHLEHVANWADDI